MEILLKLFANWCWQSEVGQIGWFSMRFPKIFYNIKMAQKFFMTSWDLSQPTLKGPQIFKKIVIALADTWEKEKNIGYAYYTYANVFFLITLLYLVR